MARPNSPRARQERIKAIKAKALADVAPNTELFFTIKQTTENLSALLMKAVKESGKGFELYDKETMIPQIAELIINVATGKSFLKTLKDQANWPRFKYYTKVPTIKAIWEEAKSCGEEYRQVERIEVAHDHAINGWQEEVYQQGQLVGTVKKFDHKLLMHMITADNPSHFKPAMTLPEAVSNNSFTIIFNTQLSEPPKAIKTIEAEAVKVKDQLPPEARENWK
jgi:hypothetical protein